MYPPQRVAVVAILLVADVKYQLLAGLESAIRPNIQPNIQKTSRSHGWDLDD